MCSSGQSQVLQRKIPITKGCTCLQRKPVPISHHFLLAFNWTCKTLYSLVCKWHLVCKWDNAHKYVLTEAALCLFTCPWCVFLTMCSVTPSFSLTWMPEGELKYVVCSVLGRALCKASTARLNPKLVNSQPGNSKDSFQVLHPGFLVD